MSAARSNSTPRYTEIRNSKALRDYAVEERFEAGIVLRGTEVKSIRAGRAQINDAFGRVKNGELWLINTHIDEYAFGSYLNHATRRDRKLLLNRSELRKIIQAMETEGRSLIPLRIYFKEALVKVEVALGTGKKSYDKRDDVRKKTALREVDRALKTRR
jgi:SsrA-binding protein